MNPGELFGLWLVLLFAARKPALYLWRAGGWKRAVPIAGAGALFVGLLVVGFLSVPKEAFYVDAFERETGYEYPTTGRLVNQFHSEKWGCTLAIVEIGPSDANRLAEHLQTEGDPDTSSPSCGGADTAARGPYLATGRTTSEISWFWWGVSEDGQTLAFMSMDMNR